MRSLPATRATTTRLYWQQRLICVLHADAANQAHARLAAQPAALILLMDSPQPGQLADQLGAVTILPLLFTLQNLVTAVQRSSWASTHIRRAP
jgi:hypothetical protein